MAEAAGNNLYFRDVALKQPQNERKQIVTVYSQTQNQKVRNTQKKGRGQDQNGRGLFLLLLSLPHIPH